MRRIAALLIVLLIAMLSSAQDDGIPNNCPYTGGVFYSQTWFVRYEPHNGRTAIVDWSSGADVRELASSVFAPQFEIGRWSPECQYVTVSYGTPDEQNVLIWTTVVYDAVNSGEVARFEGARRIPYPLTWDTNSARLLVETRFGAYIHYLGGGDVWLTSETDGNSRAFRSGSVRWDYTTNQLVGVLTIPPFGSAAYDMSSGELVGLTDQFNRELDASRASYTVQGRDGGDTYRCVYSEIYTAARSWPREEVYTYTGPKRWIIENTRVIYHPETNSVVLQDIGTLEPVRILLTAVGFTSHSRSGQDFDAGWSPGCRYLIIKARYDFDLRVYEVPTERLIFDLTGYRVYQFDIDPSSQYMAYTTRHGGYIVNLATSSIIKPFEQISFDDRAGATWTYNEVTWDISNGLVEFGIRYCIYWCTVSVFRVYDLATGELLSVRDATGQPLDFARIELFRARLDAPYGCNFRVVYHAADHALTLRDPLLYAETLAVVEESVVFDEYRYLGLSNDCRHLAVEVLEQGEDKTIVYDLTTLTRSGISFENGVFAR